MFLVAVVTMCVIVVEPAGAQDRKGFDQPAPATTVVPEARHTRSNLNAALGLVLVGGWLLGGGLLLRAGRRRVRQQGTPEPPPTDRVGPTPGGSEGHDRAAAGVAGNGPPAG